MKAKTFRIVNLIIALLVCVFTLGNALAWFAEDWEREQNYNGSSGSPYFESGTGASDDPFIISTKHHMYNLAWLQDTGKLTEKYYFKINGGVTELDMSDFWLPPIGTYAHPFEGEFDGNGAIIKNLRVTTDKTRLTNLPSQDRDDFSNAVGMFGMTAQGAVIKNFTLYDPWVEVDSETDYASDTAYKCAGLAVGYAKGSVSDIGVYQGKLSVESSGYTTINSIIGGYDSDVVDGDEITGAGEVGAGDTGIFYPQDIYNKVKNSSGTGTYEINTSIVDTTASGDYVATITSNSWIISDNNKDNTSSSDNYLGLGCFSFLATNTTQFRAKATSSTCYMGNSDGTLDATPTSKNISDLGIVDTSNKKIENIETYLYLQNSPPDDSITSVTVRNENKIEGDTEYSVSSSSKLYGNSIKFFVSNPSKLRVRMLVMSNNTTDRREVRISQTMAISNAGAFYFKDSYDKVNESNHPKKGTALVSLTTGTLGNPAYYDLDLSSLGGTKGIYSINSQGNGINILYISVEGVDSTEGGEGPKFKLSNVDFVYQVSDEDTTLVLVSDTATFIKTKVLISFTTKDLLLLYFYRPNGGTGTYTDSDSNTVTYCLEVQYRSTNTEPGVTAYGSYSVKKGAVSTLVFPPT